MALGQWGFVLLVVGHVELKMDLGFDGDGLYGQGVYGCSNMKVMI